MRRQTAVLVVLLALSGSHAVAADEAKVTAQVSSRRVFRGEQIRFQIAVEADEQADTPPDTSVITDFAVEAGKPVPQQKSFTQIINGRVTRQSSCTTVFPYVLTPTRVGQLAIPAITVTYKGTPYRTQSVSITVRDPDEQDDAVVEWSIAPAEPWVEQPVTVTIDVYLRRLVYQDRVLEEEPYSVSSPPQILVPWLLSGAGALVPMPTVKQTLEKLISQGRRRRGPGINNLGGDDGFFRRELYNFDLPRRNVRRRAKDGKEYEYYHYQLKLDFRPSKSGPLAPSPPMLRGTLWTGVKRGYRSLEPVESHVVAVAKPLAVTVKPIPLAGRPDTYTGGIGQFTIEAAATPKRVHVGDPITLSLKIKGSGTLDSLASPDLTKQAGLADRFKIHEKASAGTVEGDTKTFSHSIRAQSADVAAVPPILWSYFDPALGRFQTVRTEPIPLEVLETEKLRLTEVEDADTKAERRRRSLKALAGGIEGNYSGTDLLVNQQFAVADPAGLLAVLLVPPLVFGASAVARRRVVRLREDASLRRSRAARREAHEHLGRSRAALAGGDARAVCDALVGAINGLVADRLNLPSGELTLEELREHLAGAGAEAELIDEVADLRGHCDLARFAGGAGAAPGDLVKRTESLVKQLDRCLRA